VPMGFAVDFKRLGDNDQGPNTGGMGAYTPVPWLDKQAEEVVQKQVILPLLKELEARGLSYVGWLYSGLMWTKAGPKVIEFNVRLGDPEAQVLALADSSDWLETILYLLSSATGEPAPKAEMTRASVTVVMTSDGYPFANPEKPACELPQETFPVYGQSDSKQMVFAGAVKQGAASQVCTGKGRVLNCVGAGESLQAARANAYDLVKKINAFWPHAQYRTDIAKRVVGEGHDV